MNDEKNIFKNKLLFPEPLFDSEQLSFSAFLYFNEEPVYFTLHPTVSLLQTGCDPFRFYEIVQNKNPNWLPVFATIFNVWWESQKGLQDTGNLLKPLRNKCFKTMLLSYSRTESALEKNKEIIETTKLSPKELLNMIDVNLASHELIAHILFEKFLEIYQKQLPSDVFNQTPDKVGLSYEETRAKNIDYEELYKYCDDVLRNNSIEDLLINSYFFRVKLIQHFPNILLTNEKLIGFLNRLPYEFDIGKSQISHYEKIDVIGWELFRQLTSRYIDSHEPSDRVELVSDLKDNSREEIENLINKCHKLAEEYSGETDLAKLSSNISQHIRINAEKEIRDLLKLKKYQFKDLYDEVFSDEKTWLAICTSIVSLVAGGPILTAGAALAAFANLSAKSFKVAAQTDKKIMNSDYALIYRIKN